MPGSLLCRPTGARWGLFLLLALLAICLGGSPPHQKIKPLKNHSNRLAYPSTTREWPAYGHDAGGSRYSSLSEINRE